ncbi:MAG: nicotinamide riboside transporter PnuC [Paludibacteraceae bacterium]
MLNRTKLFDYAFLATGLLVQIITYCIAPSGVWSLVSGLCGIFSVVLCAQGNILYYFFGFAQVITYTYLCVLEHFYAEIAMNVFYFVTMIYGVFVWRRQLKSGTDEKNKVQTRQLCRNTFIRMSIVCVLLSALCGWLLSRYTDDPQPYLDAFTTVPALFAQILMILVYREQWHLWMVVNVLAFFMWLNAGDYCIAVQYIFWCANCIYGYYHWTRLIKN